MSRASGGLIRGNVDDGSGDYDAAPDLRRSKVGSVDSFATADNQENAYSFADDDALRYPPSLAQSLLESLYASRDHVFLTWHDLNFVVPNIQQQSKHAIEKEGLMDLDDDRVSTIMLS